MFSLMRKLPQMRANATVAVAMKAAAPTTTTSANVSATSHIWDRRCITTADGAQNSPEHMTKTVENIKKKSRNNETVSKQKLKEAARTLSTLQQNYSVPIPTHSTVSKDEGRDFMVVFPDLVRDLTEAARQYKSDDAAQWFIKTLEYNVPRGKKNRGILTVLTYKNLVPIEQQTPENIKLAQYLGWCVEMLQSFFIVADDIMDNSSTRRGQLCWHKMEDVGLTAINDCLMIENGIYTVLKKHFSHLDCYIDLLELFHEITFITTCGQSLDLLNSNKSVSTFTMDKYKAIVANKTAYYSFYLPFALAMHLAGYKDAEAFRQSKLILLEMGHFFQVQDDFLDCYGDPEVTGKVGTDIQDNKCSWLAVLCMQRANDKQKAIMEECYGKDDPEKVARVKELYLELNLPKTFSVFEEESYQMIERQIQQTSRGVPHKIFLEILNKIYHRDS